MTGDNTVSDLTGSGGPSETDDELCIWLGMEFIIPDKQKQHDPQDIETDLRDWLSEFLEEGLQNIDYEETGEGVDLFPKAKDWEQNPLYIRYQSESWFDETDDIVGRRRQYSVWFPVNDFKEHHELDALKEKAHYLIGDDIYNKYGEQLDVRGIIIAGSERTVREHINGKMEDIDFDEHT